MTLAAFSHTRLGVAAVQKMLEAAALITWHWQLRAMMPRRYRYKQWLAHSECVEVGNIVILIAAAIIEGEKE